MKETLMTHSPFSQNRRIRTCAATIALVLLAAACGDDSDDEGASPDTTAPATSETTAPDDTTDPGDEDDLTPEEEVLADYDAAFDAVIAAGGVPDPEHPDLLAHFSGEALTHLQASITNMELDGQASEGTVDSDADVEFDPDDEDVAWVTDCFIDRSQRVDSETREPVGDAGETIGEARRRLERIDGTWVIVKDEYLERDTCTPGED